MTEQPLSGFAMQEAVASAPLAVVAGDDSGHLVVWNQAAERLFGWSADEVLGRPLRELGIVPGDESERFERLRRVALSGEEVEGHVEAVRRRRDGSTFDARIWPAPLRGRDGEPWGFLAYIADVTEERRREARHRADEEKFRTIFSRSHDAILILDPGTDEFLDVNERACRMLGYGRDELLRLRPSDIHLDELPAFRAFVERVRRDGAARTDELTCRGVGGERVPCEISASWITVGDRSGVLAIVRDIRERRRMEAELRTAEQRYRDLYEQAPFAYFSVGTDGRVRLANRRALELLGRDELVGTSVLDLYDPDSPHGRPRALEVLECLRRGEQIRDQELLMRAADGRSVWINLSVTPVRDESGAVVASRSMAEDITARKQAEEELARSLEGLERANAELTQMAFGVAHDLSAPLRTVSSYAELLRRRYGSELGEEADELFAFIRDGVDRLRALLDGLVAFARAGEAPHARSRVDAGEVVEQTLHALRATIDETGAEVSVGDLPGVWADEVGLAQVFQNLIANALRFSAGDATPVVEITAHREPDRWRFEVADRGPGVDPESRERIFEMFQRGRDPERRRGTGIGLAVCRRVVERHGGEIWVDSTPGEGSTFSFTVPDGSGERETARPDA